MCIGGKLTKGRLVMANFGWAMVYRYLVKHYSGCFYESVFWMRLTVKLVDFK